MGGGLVIRMNPVVKRATEGGHGEKQNQYGRQTGQKHPAAREPSSCCQFCSQAVATTKQIQPGLSSAHFRLV